MTHEMKPLKIMSYSFFFCVLFSNHSSLLWPICSFLGLIYCNGYEKLHPGLGCVLLQRSSMVKRDYDWVEKFFCEAQKRLSGFNDSILGLSVSYLCTEEVFIMFFG